MDNSDDASEEDKIIALTKTSKKVKEKIVEDSSESDLEKEETKHALANEVKAGSNQVAIISRYDATVETYLRAANNIKYLQA